MFNLKILNTLHGSNNFNELYVKLKIVTPDPAARKEQKIFKAIFHLGEKSLETNNFYSQDILATNDIPVYTILGSHIHN